MSANPENLFGSAANDADAQETREWMDALSSVIQSEGPERAHFLLEQLLEHARQNSGRHAVLGQHRLCQHHRALAGSSQPRQSRDRTAPARLHALERNGHGGQGQPPPSGRRRRPGRPHRLLRVAGKHVRRRFQPLLARRERKPRRRLPATSRATFRPASMPAPTSKAACPKSNCSTSARKWTARACRATRTPS